MTLFPIEINEKPTLQRLSFYTLIVGRLLYGLSVGILAIATPRLMEETVPPPLVGLFGAAYCFSMAGAVMIADVLASILPSEKDI
jgi:MFS family permease